MKILHKIYRKLVEIEQRVRSLLITRKRVLTLKEASDYSGLSLSNLYKRTSTNEIPHSKPSGKIIYIERKKFEKYLLQNPIKVSADIEQEAIDKLVHKKDKRRKV